MRSAESEKRLVRVGVVIPPGGGRRWQARMLESLGESGVAVNDWMAAPGEVPLPWQALLPLERLARGLREDNFTRVGLKGAPLDEVCPDMLVLPPGRRAEQDLLARLPLGVLEIEPVHPARLRRGALEGRLFWRRAGYPARLAASTFTSAGGPWPLSWTGTHLAKVALMPARVLARHALMGDAFWEGCPEAEPLPQYSAGPGHWLRFLAQVAAHGVRRAWLDILHRRQWHLGLRPGNGHPLRPGFAAEPFTAMLPPGKTGWADPFLFRRDGGTWLFVEEIPSGKKGVISVMEALPQGGFGPPRRILEEPFHLSYPTVFEHQGEAYMVPETSQAGQVRLYRATDFPGGWVLDRVLLEGVSATDATFFEHCGGWWLFVNIRPEGGSSWDELHLFRSDALFGPYRPHPLNPVVSDVRRARPAGPIIRRDGRLFRPAQDCSGWYGRALAVMEIIRLDEEGYEEKETIRLDPELIPGSFCLHTLECGEGLEIVDGQRFVPIWR